MTEDDRKAGDARRRLEASLREGLRVAETDGPSSDEIEAYVDGSMEPEDRASFDEWLALDPALRREVSDLEALRDALRREARGSRTWAIWAGLAAAAGLAAVLLWRGAPPSAPVPASPTAVPAPVLTLHDAGREIGLRADGSLDGLPGVSGEIRGAVVAALQDGALAEPEGLAALRGRAGTLMGESAAPSFHVTTPLGTFVRSDRPTFRWTAHPKARGYELSIFSEALVKVASAHVSSGTEATPPAALERGRTYQWQVKALTPDGPLVAPAPPQPEARFRVLGEAESTALESALATAGDSDLVAGILLARAGVRDEAERRLARLAAANPGSVETGRLLEAIRR